MSGSIKVMRYLFILALCILTMPVYAVPARQTWFRALMNDGTYQNLCFCGDENRSFYLSEDGYIVKQDVSGQFYVKTDQKPSDLPEKRNTRATTGIGSLETAPIKSVGRPKIPVILVNFSDLALTVGETADEISSFYDKYCNGTSDGNLYTGGGSYGSVRDYFVQQSDSLFFPEFKIIGPVTVSQPMAYYGQNNPNGQKDINFKQFCREALGAAIELVPDFKKSFDNDGNGTVDLAFFIYAGYPESERGVTEDAIWPKEYISPQTIDGVTVSVMACSSELTSSNGGAVAGIGAMVHELGHSIGLPDFYDTNYKALGMSYWSLMDTGSYCVAGKTPCGLTAYERDFLRWRSLQTLEPKSQTVRLRPLETGGVGYKVVNPANADEYYILENRQSEGWDSGLRTLGHGMLVVHVDYDKSAWTSNRVNTNVTHQRMSFIPANNQYIGQNNAGSAANMLNALKGQPYPGATGNTALTDDTEPAAKVFTGGHMGQPITGIREMDNGDIVFKFMAKGQLDASDAPVASDVTQSDFKLEWNAVPNASHYRVEVYGETSEKNIALEPVVVLDSLEMTSCMVDLTDVEYTCFSCVVTAMNDEYEDSPVSEACRIDLSTVGIRAATVNSSLHTIGIYNLHGVWMGSSRQVLQTLPSGVYILRTPEKTEKIIIH